MSYDTGRVSAVSIWFPLAGHARKLLLSGVLVLMLFIGACSRQDKKSTKKTTEQQPVKVVPPKPYKPTADLMKKIRKPTSPKELLQNIKFAVDNDLLLRDDLYTDDNLKMLLGGRRVIWDNYRHLYTLPNMHSMYDKSLDMHAKVTDMADVYLSGRQYRGMGCSVYHGIYESVYNAKKGRFDTIESKKFGVLAGAPPRESPFLVDFVDELFGSNREVEDIVVEPGNPHHPAPALPKPIHKLGNKLIKYTFDKPASKVTISFQIYHDGVVKSYYFKQQEK